MLGHSCCVCFSIVVASGSYSQFEVHGLLIAVASLVVEQGLQGAWAQWLQHVGSVVFSARGLWSTGSVVCTWDLPRPGVEPMCPALAGRVLLNH